MPTDEELLLRFVSEGSEEAFATLVRRHVAMVYLAAFRRVGRNAHSADDVTQRVFTDLARKAHSLADRPSLAGWLHTGTRFAAAQVVRSERRRASHEQEAQAMNEIDTTSPGHAERLEAFLDEAMDLLAPGDREAVILHFLEGCTFPEVAATLGVSADAVRMRVNRSLDRIRAGLAKQGIESSSAVLNSVLLGLSAGAVPVDLARNVAGHALSHAGKAGSGVSAVRNLIRRVRSSQVAPRAGAAFLVGLVGLWYQEFHRTGVNDAFRAYAPGRLADPSPGPAAVNAPSSPTEIPTNPLQTLAPPGNSIPAVDGFADLSDPEKHILKSLYGVNGGGIVPGLRKMLHVGIAAPNAQDFEAGRELLLSRGWVQIGRSPQSIFLTPAGRTFCAAHAAEIEVYPAFYGSNHRN